MRHEFACLEYVLLNWKKSSSFFSSFFGTIFEIQIPGGKELRVSQPHDTWKNGDLGIYMIIINI